MKSGWRTFGVIWFGQMVSTLGSSMTSFGLAIWVYQETGSALSVALVVAAARLPLVVASPIAGALIDRWDRRWAMLVADAGAALGTLVTVALIATGVFEIWHLYVTLAVTGLFSAFQGPAYSASITLLVPRAQYARASGFVQVAGSVGRIAAPALGAAVVVGAGLGWLFVIDLATFLVATVTLLAVRFPSVPEPATPRDPMSGLLAEARQGLAFVVARRGLLILMGSFTLVSAAFAVYGVLSVPFLLEVTDPSTAGAAVSVAAASLAVGSLTLAVWGGPANRVRGVFLPIAAMGVGLVVMGLVPSVAWFLAGAVLMHGTHPIAGGSSQSIWQSKVPADLQGRVFAFRQMASMLPVPLAYLGAGVLADVVFEPLMAAPGNVLTDALGWGPGRGIGLMFAVIGIIAVAIAAAALRHPRIRALDSEVPDLEHVTSP